jgi:hypothetical protein
MCGPGQQAQASGQQSGGMMCGMGSKAADDPMADKSEQEATAAVWHVWLLQEHGDDGRRGDAEPQHDARHEYAEAAVTKLAATTKTQFSASVRARAKITLRPQRGE